MKIVKQKNIAIAILQKETIIEKTHEILDAMASIRYNENIDNVAMIIHKESLEDKFFDLKTKFAGDLLQKFSNYKMSLAIVGDFSEYTSKSLRDFIRECNRGSLIYFLDDENQAIEKLSKTK